MKKIFLLILIFGSEEYKILMDSPVLMLMSSGQGNVSYVIDKKAKSFVHAQHAYNEKINGLISKSCVGIYSK